MTEDDHLNSRDEISFAEDMENPSDNGDAEGNKMMGWVRRSLGFFTSLAAIGLVLTLVVHVALWAGFPLGISTTKLFFGVFVVWLPTVLVFGLLRKDSRYKGSWKACTRESPAWMKYMSSVFFIYAYISFGYLLFGMYKDITSGGSDGEFAKFIYMGLSGFYLAFYSAAMSVLYSARKILG